MPKSEESAAPASTAPESENPPAAPTLSAASDKKKARADRIEAEAKKRVQASFGALSLEDARLAAVAQAEADDAAAKAERK